jgi:hypothetical protein
MAAVPDRHGWLPWWSGMWGCEEPMTTGPQGTMGPQGHGTTGPSDLALQLNASGYRELARSDLGQKAIEGGFGDRQAHGVVLNPLRTPIGAPASGTASFQNVFAPPSKPSSQTSSRPLSIPRLNLECHHAAPR